MGKWLINFRNLKSTIIPLAPIQTLPLQLKYIFTDLETMHTHHDIYSFDQFTLSALDPAIPFHPGSSNLPHVYIFQCNPYYKGPLTACDWIGDEHTTALYAYFVVFDDFQYSRDLRQHYTTRTML